MSNYELKHQPARSIIAIVVTFTMFSTASVSFAQKVVNFSGKWEYDKAKSSQGTQKSGYEGKLVRQISQTDSAISYCDIYVRTGDSEWKTVDESFSLDGREQVLKDEISTRRKLAKWSEDGKSLTLTYAETYVEDGVSRELLFVETYGLSDDVKTLTIETHFKNQVTGETTTKDVYYKK